MKIQNLTVEAALATLRSGADGLSTEEARHRLVGYGLNEIKQVRREPATLRFLKGFTHFFAIILWIAAALSFFAGWREPGQGMVTLGFAIVGVIVLNGVFSFWQEYRAEQAVAALKKLLPRQVKVLRAGKTSEESASNLVPGDVVLLAEGDHVPADCRLVEAFGVRVNNATITGESLPHSRNARPCAEAPVFDPGVVRQRQYSRTKRQRLRSRLCRSRAIFSKRHYEIDQSIKSAAFR